MAATMGSLPQPLTAALLSSVEKQYSSVRKGSYDDDVSTACSHGAADKLSCWTKRRVLSLCEELLKGYSTPQFQAELKKLQATAPSMAQVAGRMELALTVQREILPRYGFAGTVEGVEAMREAICPFLVDWMVKRLVDDIDRALGLPPNATANAAKGPEYAREQMEKGGSFTDASESTDDAASEHALSEKTLETTDGNASPRIDRFTSGCLADDTSASPFSRQSTRQAQEEISFTKPQVLELLGEILRALSDEVVQSELQKLNADDPHRKELVLKARGPILQKFGLPGTSFGFMLMLDAITPFSNDFLVKHLLSQIDSKIGLPNDTTTNLINGKGAPAQMPKQENPAKALHFSRDQALKLCSELLEGFRALEFQAELKELLNKSKNKVNVPERAALALKVQSKILPKYGLPGTSEGVLVMLEKMTPHAGDWMLTKLVNTIDETLGLPAETTLNTLALLSDA